MSIVSLRAIAIIIVMEAYPVKIAMLSRFRTPKQVKDALRGLKAGTVDIVVGTHRLLQKDVRFHDLGLIIIDEEQRFGVRHKEKLKETFPGVDVLTLSATPIPRTLNMAMCHTLLTAGHTTTADLNEADAIIVNTCGFIESAKQEAIDTILDAARFKQGAHPPKIIVTGCLAERYKEQIQAEIPEVDATVGIGCNGDIAAVVSRALGGERVEAFGAKTALPLEGKRIVSTPRHYAYLKVAEGCNNRCSYCAIPLIRGPLRSRTLADVLEEARWLASEGVKELILVAQDITAFGDDRGQNETAALLDALQQVDGIVWIRLLYAYPERVTDEFIAAMMVDGVCSPVVLAIILAREFAVSGVRMSKGTKEKVQLILVMSRRAQLYLLDEPIGGVDPAARDYILQTILTNYNPEAAVVISTHLIGDVEKVLDQVVMPVNPNNPPPTIMATSTQMAESPVESPRILGPRILPSNCCSKITKMVNHSALHGLTISRIIILGMAPINGPKNGMTFVMPMTTLMSSGKGI